MKLCENLSIGVETWLCINALEEEMDTKPFFVCVKAFYSATLQKFFKKFPFGDTILQDFLHRNSQIFFFLLKTFLLLGTYYKDCNGVEKPRPGLFWWEVGKIKTLLGELRFANLAKLMAGLLAICSSNADSERGFSILRKIHTCMVQRSNLDQSTVVALMSLKLNSDDCCHEVQFEQELLKACKKLRTSTHLGK